MSDSLKDVGKVRFGCLARCSAGTLGLVLSYSPVPVDHYEDKDEKAWIGVHINHHPELGISAGDPWSSRNPTLVAEEASIGLSQEALLLLLSKVVNNYRSILFEEARPRISST